MQGFGHLRANDSIRSLYNKYVDQPTMETFKLLHAPAANITWFKFPVKHIC
jgi:hypothetical protein